MRAPPGGTTQPAVGWWRRVAGGGWSSVGVRVALGSALGAAAALGIAAALSLGAGPVVRLPPAVVLPSSSPVSGVATQLHNGVPTSTTAPAAPSGGGSGVPGDVTVVMPTPQVVVQPADAATGTGSGTDVQERAGATSETGGGAQHASTSSGLEQSSSTATSSTATSSTATSSTATSSTATSSTATSSTGSANAPSSTTLPLASAGGGDAGSGGGAPDH